VASAEAAACAPVILASASPRRLELLAQLKIDCEVRPAHIDERVGPGESPERYVERMAREKTSAMSVPGRVTLGADTVVVLGDEILGKPSNREEGVTMLSSLSDTWHRVLTSVAATDGDSTESVTVTTDVHFRTVTREEAERYWATGEPQDKAGGYGIQGIGSIFADEIRGSYSAVVGLPLAETERLLERFGVDTWRRR